jgi:UDP-2,3-diacylglucosamine hydrolase
MNTANSPETPSGTSLYDGQTVITPDEGDHIFLSDVHLGGFDDAFNADIERRLHHLLQFVEEKKLRLYVLGDLFDYWMEYRGYFPPYGEKILQAFERLNAARPVLYVTGNHDNWTGSRIGQAGFDLEHESRRLNIAGKSVLVLHGDGLKDPDMQFPRPVFHRLLRNVTFLKLYQSVFPPKLGIRLMRAFSRNAKRRDRKKLVNLHHGAENIDRWALKMLNETGLDAIICGHHHQPLSHENSKGTYFNLGNFYRLGSLLIHTKGVFQPVLWNDERNVLSAFNPPGLSF